MEIHIWQLIRDEAGKILTWRLVYANPAALKTWGIESLEDVCGRETDDIFGPGSADHFLPIIERIMEENQPHEFRDYFANLDKHFRFTTIPLGDLFLTTADDISEFVEQQTSLENINQDLEQQIRLRNARLHAKEEEVRVLQGIIPICGYCHNIRDDEGAWSRLEECISDHSDAQFSHGVCPVCLDMLRAEANQKKGEDGSGRE